MGRKMLSWLYFLRSYSSWIMTKRQILHIISESASKHNLNRVEKWQVFCNVCDNALHSGVITKAQHTRWTTIFWSCLVKISPNDSATWWKLKDIPSKKIINKLQNFGGITLISCWSWVTSPQQNTVQFMITIDSWQTVHHSPHRHQSPVY